MVRCWQNDLQDLVTKSTSLNMVTKSTHLKMVTTSTPGTTSQHGARMANIASLSRHWRSWEAAHQPVQHRSIKQQHHTFPQSYIQFKLYCIYLSSAMPNRIIGVFGVYDTLPFQRSTSQAVYNIPYSCPTPHHTPYSILCSSMSYSASQNSAT